MALCLPDQYFHMWSMGTNQPAASRKHFCREAKKTNKRRRPDIPFPCLLCCGYVVARNRLACTTAAADLQTALICKGGGRRPPPASHIPRSLSLLVWCLPVFLLGSSLPVSSGPVSLHLYLRVQQVLDGGDGGWVGGGLLRSDQRPR